MRYRAFATDYDGTLAHDGRVDEPTLKSLERARACGLTLLLVTGRELTDLANTFAHTAMFDLVVAENGAVVLTPSSSNVEVLADPAPYVLIDHLTRHDVPISVGHSIVATTDQYEQDVRNAIAAHSLAWHVILNKGSIMALPGYVNKAFGLARALAVLGIDLADTVGVGDAENDQSFLAACGLSAAVANALPEVKARARVVLESSRGAGVAELVERVCAGEFD